MGFAGGPDAFLRRRHSLLGFALRGAGLVDCKTLPLDRSVRFPCFLLCGGQRLPQWICLHFCLI